MKRKSRKQHSDDWQIGSRKKKLQQKNMDPKHKSSDNRGRQQNRKETAARQQQNQGSRNVKLGDRGVRGESLWVGDVVGLGR